MTLARVVFCASLGATLFWSIGAAAEWIIGDEPPVVLCAAAAVLGTVAAAGAVFRSHPQFLVPKVEESELFLWLALAWTVLAYLAVAVVVGVVGYLVLRLSGPPPESSPEPGLLVGLLTIWFPLWPAPAIGVSLGWWRIRGESEQRRAAQAPARSHVPRPR